MVSSARCSGVWCAAVLLWQVLLLVGSGPSWGRELLARDALLSLVRPIEVYSSRDAAIGPVQEILSLSIQPSGDPSMSPAQALIELPLTRDLHSGAFQDMSQGSTAAPRRTRIASLGLVGAISGRRASTLLDSGEEFGSTGRLAADPRGLFSSFEIEVDRAHYTIALYGIRADEKKQLFSSRVGLGSAEFPTPRGSYYITRIFDDKPIWIPPNTWWAWGQSPSRSVYGGHMMPLFMKRPLKGSESADYGLDIIAPRMTMVDSGGYRVHGTDTPWSVGSAQSHGCVRMLNRTVKVLADQLKMYVGTTTRGESANGPYVNLARPVKITLY